MEMENKYASKGVAGTGLGLGNIDIDALGAKLKKRIEKKGRLEVSLPLMPKLSFSPSDVDEILAVIKE